jgi:phosphate:Na+ symporter
VHVLFNVLGVAIWLPFIGILADIVRTISPASGSLAADIPRQVANAHTIFNIANTALFLPFATQLARLVTWLVPDRPIAAEDEVRARYLDRDLLIAPSLALDRARLEIVDMGDRVLQMQARALDVVLDGDPEQFRELAAMDDAVDTLHGAVITYLGEISRTALGEQQTEELMRMFEAANDLENIGDILETNFVALAEARFEKGVQVSDETRQLLTEFHQLVLGAVEEAVLAVTQKNRRAARAVMKRKKQVNRLEEKAVSHQARRLVADAPQRLDTYALETDLLQAMKRVYYFAKRMARAAVPAELSGEVH